MERVPVMIINDVVLFPGMEYRIETNDIKIEEAINKIEQDKTKKLVIIHSLDGLSTDDVTQFPSVGLIGSLSFKLMIPNSKMRAVFVCDERVSLSCYEKENGIYYANITDLPVKSEKGENEAFYCDLLLRAYEKYIHQISSASNAMLNHLSNILSLESLTDSLATILPISMEEKKKYLYEISPIKRAKSL